MLRETPPMSVHEARTASAVPDGFWREHRKGFIIATVAAPILALLGALGTDQIALLPRLAYWLILMETGALIGLGVSTGLQAWGRLGRHPWAEGLAISIGIALPLTLVVIAMSGIFFQMPTPGWAGFVTMFGTVTLVCGVITAINYAVRRGDPLPLPANMGQPSAPPEGASPAPPAVASPPRLLERLPPPFRHGPVVALQAEDHYLRVHTPAGSTLILMRLSDAIAELDGADGAQIHRSWWVARSAVERVERGDGRATLHLADNVAVPVSRTHYRSLRDAGWF